MNFLLRVWRQKSKREKGAFENYEATEISPDMSFLEMLDTVNEKLASGRNAPIAFDHDCREGICGMCSLVINGRPHGPRKGTTACQLHMRHFTDGETIIIEPWRASAFPIIRDLVVDRRAFDRVIQAGGYVTVRAGSAPDANSIPIPQEAAEAAFDAAACIGCAACVAACPNASASLFVAAKAQQLSLLPQGQPERHKRTVDMIEEMDRNGFGHCTNHYECESACPKEIPVRFIADLNRDFRRALLTAREFKPHPSPLEEE